MPDGSQETSSIPLKDRYPSMFKESVDITEGLHTMFKTGQDFLAFYEQYAQDRLGKSVAFPIVQTQDGKIFMLGAGHSQRRLEDLLSTLQISTEDVSVSCELTGLRSPSVNPSDRIVPPFITITDNNDNPEAIIKIETGDPEEGKYFPKPADYELYKKIFKGMSGVKVSKSLYSTQEA